MNSKIQRWIDKNIDRNRFENKNVFITGGNSGIGLELAKQCAYLGSNIFLLCRSLDKAEKAKEEIVSEYPKTKIQIIRLDLADFDSIKDCVSKVKNFNVDMFVNNAGVYHLPHSFTKQNHEIIMGTNFIGTMYLYDNVIDYLRNQKHPVKILFESSLTSRFTHINFDDFFMDKKYNEMTIYARSKYCVNSLYFEACENNKTNDFISLCLAHPGVAYTPLIKKGYKNRIFEGLAHIFMKTVFHSPEKAALSLLAGLDSTKKTCEVGPRGVLGISGYPHKWTIKKQKDNDKLIEFARNLINFQ